MSTTPTPQLILASASPRRRELLAYLGVTFEVRANDGEDQPLPPPPALRDQLPPLTIPADQHPTLLAWRKACVAAEDAERPVLAADTIVVLDGEVLGKPKDAEHARRMLGRLSGRTHQVLTGVVVLDPARPELLLHELTSALVQIASLSEEQIAAYVATGEPLDKAGSYGIQGLGGSLVQGVEGSYTAVVGLPLVATERLLRAADIAIPVAADEAYRRWAATLEKEPPPCNV